MRILALVEAVTLTGPVKNLLSFGQFARQSRSGVELSIAAFFRPALGPSNPFLDAVRSAAIPLDVIPERGRFDRSVLPAISGILERRRPDILQTHAVKSHFLVRYGGFHWRAPWIAFQHGYTREDLKMRMYIQLDRWSLRAASRVVTVCKPFADALARTGVHRDRIDVISNAITPPPPVPPEEVLALRTRLNLPQDAKVLLSIGRLSHEKGHADLIDALDLLARDRPDLPLCLLLVGDGIERASLERRAAAARHKIVFTGHQADVWPLFAAAHLFVLPSHSEGSPNVLLEAMAAKVPIVATAVGGVPETVQHGETAWLVRPHAPAELAHSIAQALAQPDDARRMADHAFARVLADFSPEARSKNLLRLYRSVAPRPSAVPMEDAG